MKIIKVEVQQDHLASFSRTSPLNAVVELIWNGLDADADTVSVDVVTQELGGVDSVIVTDDGHGIAFEDAEEAFQGLGGSWKAGDGRSKGQKRILHGKEGKGRWRAFALGTSVDWESTTSTRSDGNEKIVIRGRATDPGTFRVTDPVGDPGPIGTKVVVAGSSRPMPSLLGDDVVQTLTSVFAPYLEQYPAVSIVYRGRALDPSALQGYREEYKLAFDGGSAVLTVIEWIARADRDLFLCDENGVTLHRLPAEVPAPGFDFTAYIKWEGFRERESMLEVAEMDPSLRLAVEAAREKLRVHFRERAPHRTRAVIEEWKKEQVYPYPDAPNTVVQVAEQQLFDVVATAAAKTVNVSRDRRSRQLSLRLIKEALERSPSSVHRILREVLELPRDRLDEFEKLLDRTTLAAIITVSKTITDRLDFLASLKEVVFDPTDETRLRERSQLHKILENEIWIFGEEFLLGVSDKGFREVLRKHIQILGREDPAPESVVDAQGKTRIVDLMLARELPQARNRREHVVIELKAPDVRLRQHELGQITNYGTTVAKDSRFNKVDVEWDFFLIGTEWDDYVEEQAHQKDRPIGLVYQGKNGVRVWAKTWAQLIAECEHRLKFVQDALGYEADDKRALEYLRETYAKYLPTDNDADV